MTPKLMTGNEAAAWGARLAEIEYLPAFPITPQTEIIETLSRWIEQKDMIARTVMMESEHSMITAAGGAAATGVRVFTATSSQGLLYASEMLYTVTGWRVPFVLVNVSRGLSSPITLEPDHNDVLAMRDCGFLQIHAATCQEVLDSVLMGYRLGEDERVRLPVLVNLDGFYLSFTREPVSIPELETVRDFLPPFQSGSLVFRGGTPRSMGVAVLGGAQYSYFRYETHLAALAALEVYDRLSEDFLKTFGRSMAAVESYRMEDAEYAFMMMGSFSTKARAAVDSLRKAGWAIGLVQPRLLRPFPAEALRVALGHLSAVAVIDQNLSMGMGGILHTETASALYGRRNPGDIRHDPMLLSYVGGLGGRDITMEEFFTIAEETRQAAQTRTAPLPRLLFTQKELEQVRKAQTVAGAVPSTNSETVAEHPG